MRYLVVGLGNPGHKYERHNVGSDLLEFFILNSSKQVKKVTNNLFQLHENLYFLMEPDMMNICGKAIKDTFDKYMCTEIIVVVDDLETKFSKVKTHLSSSAKGHNGIRDIIKHFNCKIWKILVGIGRPENNEYLSNKNISISDYVTSKFSLEEQQEFPTMSYRVIENLFHIIDKKKEDFEFK